MFKSIVLPKALAAGLAAAALVLLPSLSPAQTSAPSTAKPLTKVMLRLDWKSGGQHVPFFLGKDRGFFAAEGVDLQIISGSGSADSVKQLGAGTVEMALVDALVLVQAAEQGVPVRAVAVYYQRTPIALLSPKSKPVTSPAQLASGIKVGSKRASSTSQGLIALLAAHKIDQKKVNIVDIGFGVQPLLLGQVDALMGFSMNEAIEAETNGMPVHEMLISDHGVDAYGLTLAASQKFLAANPDVIRGFLRATRRSLEAVMTDKPAAVLALSRSASEIDQARELKVVAKAEPFLYVKGADIRSFGTQTAVGWQQTIETATRLGLVEKAPKAADVFVVGMDR